MNRGHSPDNSLVSSSTSSVCPHSSLLRGYVDKLGSELDYVREKVRSITNAVERLGIEYPPDDLRSFALADFRELSIKPESQPLSSDIRSGVLCNCHSCTNLLSQRATKFSHLDYLKKEIVERLAAVETLADGNNDKLLTILITGVKKVTKGFSKDDEDGPVSKKPKLESIPMTSPVQNEIPSTSGLDTTDDLSLLEDEMLITGEVSSSPVVPEPSRRNSCRGTVVTIEYEDEDPENIDIGPIIKLDADGYHTIYDNIPSEQEQVADSVSNVNYAESEHSQSLSLENASQVESAEEFDPLRQTVEELVFSDTKVLEKILNDLQFMELKIARCVSPTWRKMASDLILRRDCCSVVIQFDSKTNSFRRTTWSKWKANSSRFNEVIMPDETTLTLNRILENSIDFPTTSFAIANGNLGSRDIQDLFEIQGLKIKQLFLKGNPKMTSKETLTILLERFVPNLKYLEIRNLEYPWRNSEKLVLPSLEILCFYNCYKTPAAIFRGSPKIEDVSDPIGDQKLVRVLMDCKKLNLVKKIQCDEDTRIQSLTLFAQGSTGTPKLDGLKLMVDKKFTHFTSDRKAQLATVFTTLLQSSKDTMEDLCLSGLFPCSEIKFPVLTQLEFLDLDWDPLLCVTATPCFPPGIDLGKIFPNIHVLDAGTLHCSKDSAWDLHFPSVKGRLVTVETLHVPDSATELWMRRLHDLCPNFKTLVILALWGKVEILPKVFKLWPHLESMDLNIYEMAGKGGGGKKSFYLDSALTGLSEETCASLIDVPQQVLMRQTLGPSILDLPDLNRIWISLGCPHAELIKVIRNAITRISGICLFKVKPNLRASIWYDQNCPYSPEFEDSLASVGPYVNLCHKHQR